MLSSTEWLWSISFLVIVGLVMVHCDVCDSRNAGNGGSTVATVPGPPETVMWTTSECNACCCCFLSLDVITTFAYWLQDHLLISLISEIKFKHKVSHYLLIWSYFSIDKYTWGTAWSVIYISRYVEGISEHIGVDYNKIPIYFLSEYLNCHKCV